jgi:hypothetical protein
VPVLCFDHDATPIAATKVESATPIPTTTNEAERGALETSHGFRCGHYHIAIGMPPAVLRVISAFKGRMLAAERHRRCRFQLMELSIGIGEKLQMRKNRMNKQCMRLSSI